MNLLTLVPPSETLKRKYANPPKKSLIYSHTFSFQPVHSIKSNIYKYLLIYLHNLKYTNTVALQMRSKSLEGGSGEKDFP